MTANRLMRPEPSRTASWVTANVAARLTGKTVPEVIAAVQANPDTITEKVCLIGQKQFHLIDRNEIVAHFLTTDAPPCGA